MIMSKALSDLTHRVRRTAQRMRRDSRKGSSVIEFAFIAPVLLLFICGIIETGVIFYGQSTLFYATNDAARMVRTGQLTGTVTASALKTQICNRIDGLITTSQCNANLQVDMRSFSGFGAASYGGVTNANGTLDSNAMKMQPVAACNIVLVRAFYPWAIMTPLMKTLYQTATNGTHLLYAAVAFRNEPYSNNPC
jgi:Flp pilus assembly protein TadG